MHAHRHELLSLDVTGSGCDPKNLRRASRAGDWILPLLLSKSATVLSEGNGHHDCLVSRYVPVISFINRTFKRLITTGKQLGLSTSIPLIHQQSQAFHLMLYMLELNFCGILTIISEMVVGQNTATALHRYRGTFDLQELNTVAINKFY